MKPKCKNCSYTLTAKKFENRTWYECHHCTSHFIPISSMQSYLSESEFYKFQAEIKKSQIVSSIHCPVCMGQLTKIIDLLHKYEVEVCAACQLVWLNPHQGQTIKTEQMRILNEGTKISLNNSEPDLIARIHDRAGDGRYDNPIWGHDRLEIETQLDIGSRMINSFFSIFEFENFSKSYPLLSAMIKFAVLFVLFRFMYVVFFGKLVERFFLSNT